MLKITLAFLKSLNQIKSFKCLGSTNNETENFLVIDII